MRKNSSFHFIVVSEPSIISWIWQKYSPTSAVKLHQGSTYLSISNTHPSDSSLFARRLDIFLHRLLACVAGKNRPSRLFCAASRVNIFHSVLFCDVGKKAEFYTSPNANSAWRLLEDEKDQEEARVWKEEEKRKSLWYFKLDGALNSLHLCRRSITGKLVSFFTRYIFSHYRLFLD